MRPSHLPMRISLRRTGLGTMAYRTPDSMSAGMAGAAMADALRATTKLNMNMNRTSDWGMAVATSLENSQDGGLPHGRERPGRQ